MKTITRLAIPATLLAVTAIAGAGDSTLVTFDDGNEGWTIQNAATILPMGGNPGAHLDHYQFETFGINIANTTTPAFLGNYVERGPVELTIDVTVDEMNFFGSPVLRSLVVEFRNSSLAQGGLPYVSVWTEIGLLQSNMPWTTFTATIEDPSATDLPAGWGGYGAEDPKTFEPILPEGVSFADVLSNVDEIVFTTYVPGFFYGPMEVGLGVDNVGIAGASTSCPADLDGSGTVDGGDLGQLLGAWGTGDVDLNGDGMTDGGDLGVMLGAWGDC